jgi:hypothetical protein
MSANKITLRIDSLTDNDFIKIPISLDFNSVGQQEAVDKDFVNVEVEKSINPIVDYEKVRFTPLKNDGTIIDDLIINLKFLNNTGTLKTKISQSIGSFGLFFRSLGNRSRVNSTIIPTTYGEIGFTDEDIKFRKNRFLNSFLKLSFYDSDVTTNQNLISIITIFSKITIDYIASLTENGIPAEGGGLPIHADKFPVSFKLQNPITNPEGFAEGYYLYHFKSDVVKNSLDKKYLYMKAEFNNASLGTTTLFTTTTDFLAINDLLPKLHVRYLLTRTNTGFYYKLDDTYNNADNITQTTNGVALDLFEIQVK